MQQQPNPIDALQFLDGILAKVAGSRQDHVAIQGALGVVAKALQPTEEVPLEVLPAPRADVTHEASEVAAS